MSPSGPGTIVERGICVHNRINVRSNYLANLAPEIYKLPAIANAVFAVARSTTRAEIKNDEIGFVR